MLGGDHLYVVTWSPIRERQPLNPLVAVGSLDLDSSAGSRSEHSSTERRGSGSGSGSAVSMTAKVRATHPPPNPFIPLLSSLSSPPSPLHLTPPPPPFTGLCLARFGIRCPTCDTCHLCFARFGIRCLTCFGGPFRARGPGRARMQVLLTCLPAYLLTYSLTRLHTCLCVCVD